MRLALLACALVAASLPAPAAAAKTPIPGLVTPSGNIRCFETRRAPVTLHCEIHSSSYGSSLQRRCITQATVDWHGFELGARTRGAVSCSGGILYSPDTERIAYRTVSYGTTWRSGPISCLSARTGLTCRNRAGHGLFISRERWRTF
jgi:hypothetical protein